MIPQRNISLIANLLAKESGKRIPEPVIERDYVLAWFLAGLGKHPLRDRLAFKGGTALRRCWFKGYRFSEDMDFTLTEPTTLEDILAGFNEIFAAVEIDSGVHIDFKGKKREQGRNSHTFFLRYQGPLPAMNDVKVDITIDETFCYPLHERPMLRQYDMFNDLPEEPTVNVYSLEEIVVEKITALSDRKRNEPRDLYDLWYLLNHQDFWLAGMLPELETKLAFRQRTTEDVMENIAGKQERLSRLWTHRLSPQMIDLPAYDDVFRDVKRALRSANLTPNGIVGPRPR